MSPTDHSLVRMLSGARELIGAEVLVVDQDPQVHSGMTQLLSAASLHVTCVREPDAALHAADRQFFSVMLVDLDTPTPGAGLDVVRALKARSPSSMVVAMTPRRSFDDAVAAVRAGAIDLILKSPESVAYLRERVMDAAGRSVGKREVDSVLAEIRSAQDDFLQRFMDSERRALDLTDRLAGRDPGRAMDLGELTVLIVDEVDELFDALTAAAPPGFAFHHATSGGQGMDRASAGRFHYAMVAADLHDLPTSMVVQAVRTSNPEIVVLTFRGPAENGRVDLVESQGVRTIVQPFTDASQLVSRMAELAEAFRAKSRERRYIQNFREKHYDFLRRYVELKTKLDRAVSS